MCAKAMIMNEIPYTYLFVVCTTSSDDSESSLPSGINGTFNTQKDLSNHGT